MNVEGIFGIEPSTAREAITRAEAAGYDGIMVPEVAHDPFVSLSVAAATTDRVRLSSGIAVAFARNPMTVAVTASDLHQLSHGRFVLGLGSQIAAHVTRRYSMPWSAPAPRMREFVAAVRAIWRSWDTGEPLDFRGEHYRHTLMTPMFSHGPSENGRPPIHIAGVGPKMTALAGEIADGYLAHGFTTADYLRDVTITALDDGLRRTGRTRADVEISVPVMIALVDDDDDPKLAAARATIAFYGSTPAYRPVLDHHGWSALGEELHRLSKAGEWATMPNLIDDDVLHAFTAIGGPTEIARTLTTRFAAHADRLQLGLSTDPRHLTLVDLLRR